ncbi:MULTISPECIES: hypothetical protein [unclassified Campylobacter]|uniref:hypothetical protein n=1 Tax=unclassified Campylobacter TaxID=2593542 RepID=UPI001237E7ED|nr:MULTISPECIES: hypothetical protein [unclassified Campylobacter]KAA6227186.1 hypothetical protein FMM57_04415 [Campylobacter sp. LR286c]KAA6227940.1 hypothetical protein FMM54_02060 [Campylobacter sp. LR185c]KAA6228349.1 hypothetical protein FMM55_01870 [Campylobacter sp. LR196d]KAA6229350.1 hypothetical protein FMM58_08305 [Campylobacter sp. LR291e]KAA6231156.1 hypothetical protein FMM56_05570 [Campylobacter sp. LR264d]
MVYEIQKIFLLNDFSLITNLNKDGINFKTCNINFFYTKISKNESLKFYKIDDKYFKKHIFEGDFLEEERNQITKKEFKDAKKNALTKPLNKISYMFNFCSFKAFIEVYESLNLCLLRVFFSNLKDSENFSLPSEFKAKKKLSLNEFCSKKLSLYGNEFIDFDIDKCFKIIEKNQNFTLNFPSSIKAFDGFRIFLFYLFKKLKFFWSTSLQEKKEEDFANLQLYAKKLFIVLSSFDDIFDKRLSQNLALKFKDLAQKTKSILNQNEKKEEALLFLLSSDNLNDLFSDFDTFIKEGLFYEGQKKDYFFKNLIALQIRKKLIIFKKTLKDDINFDLEFKYSELKILLEFFAYFFDLKSLNKLHKKYFSKSMKKFLNKMQTRQDKFFTLISKTNKYLRIYKGL